MTEHELFIERRMYESRVYHTRFRRRHLKAEKQSRIVHLLRRELRKELRKAI